MVSRYETGAEPRTPCRRSAFPTAEFRQQLAHALRWLFSFRGRLSRLPFWLGVLVMGGLTRISTEMAEKAGPASSKYAFACIAIVGLWSCIALQVKRLHDINLPGWLLLANLIPVVGPLATLALAGVKRGHSGPNRFGPDPKMQV